VRARQRWSGDTFTATYKHLRDSGKTTASGRKDRLFSFVN
jgi:hypothetical protein